MKFSCLPLSSRAMLAAALLCLLIAARPASAQRLPKTVIPEHYTLLLTPDLKAATFTGVETIEVTLAEPTSAITLNSAEIAFQSVTITAGGQQQTASVTEDRARSRPLSSSLKVCPPARQLSLSPTPGSSTTNCAASIFPKPPSATTP